MKEKVEYLCPLCETSLRQQIGDQMHPGSSKHGITLDCPSRSCPAQEVMGHGDNLKEAFEVIQHKYQK